MIKLHHLEDSRYWLHYAEGSAMLPFLLHLYAGRIGEASAPIRPRIDSEIQNHLSHFSAAIAGREFLVGNAFSSADIQMNPQDDGQTLTRRTPARGRSRSGPSSPGTPPGGGPLAWPPVYARALPAEVEDRREAQMGGRLAGAFHADFGRDLLEEEHLRTTQEGAQHFDPDTLCFPVPSLFCSV